MLRMLLRFTGLCLLAVAFTGLIIDIAHSIAAKKLLFTEIGAALMELAPIKLASVQFFIEHHLPQFVWDPLLATVMRLPAWLGIGFAGWLMLWLAKRPAPKIGFSSR